MGEEMLGPPWALRMCLYKPRGCALAGENGLGFREPFILLKTDLNSSS